MFLYFCLAAGRSCWYGGIGRDASIKKIETATPTSALGIGGRVGVTDAVLGYTRGNISTIKNISNTN